MLPALCLRPGQRWATHHDIDSPRPKITRTHNPYHFTSLPTPRRQTAMYALHVSGVFVGPRTCLHSQGTGRVPHVHHAHPWVHRVHAALLHKGPGRQTGYGHQVPSFVARVSVLQVGVAPGGPPSPLRSVTVRDGPIRSDPVRDGTAALSRIRAFFAKLCVSTGLRGRVKLNCKRAQHAYFSECHAVSRKMGVFYAPKSSNLHFRKSS